MNILIIYDLAMNRAILERTLRMEGHLTVGTSRVEDLRPLLGGKNKFDLVIIDVLRPEIDGINIYKSYLKLVGSSKQKLKKLPFILVNPAQTEETAIQNVGRLKYAKELGFFDIISKPLDHNRLKSSLARIEGKVDHQDQVEHLGEFPKTLKNLANNLINEHDSTGAALMIDLLETTIPMLRTTVK